MRGRPTVDTSDLTPGELAEREETINLARALNELDHYAALGLAPDATTETVRVAWRELQRRFNPSRISERHLADRESDLRDILDRADTAFEVLSSTTLRERYDRILGASLGQAPAAGGGEQSEAELERQRKARQELVAANLKRAEELIVLGEHHLAIRALETATRFDPQAGNLVRLAQLLRKNPTWTGRALEVLRKAVELDPNCTEAWLEQAEIWSRRGHTERRRKALERALATDPQCDLAIMMYRQSFGDAALQKVLQRFSK
jgi:curved DNA-binding protein CbpA